MTHCLTLKEFQTFLKMADNERRARQNRYLDSQTLSDYDRLKMNITALVSQSADPRDNILVSVFKIIVVDNINLELERFKVFTFMQRNKDDNREEIIEKIQNLKCIYKISKKINNLINSHNTPINNIDELNNVKDQLKQLIIILRFQIFLSVTDCLNFLKTQITSLNERTRIILIIIVGKLRPINHSITAILIG